jgi:hypothetical protein
LNANLIPDLPSAVHAKLRYASFGYAAFGSMDVKPALIEGHYGTACSFMVG